MSTPRIGDLKRGTLFASTPGEPPAAPGQEQEPDITTLLKGQGLYQAPGPPGCWVGFVTKPLACQCFSETM